MSGTNGWLIRRTAGLIGAAVALMLIVAPAALAQAPFADIQSAGPLSNIWISNDLSCQIAHSGNSVGEFYPGGPGPADCGTFLSVQTNSQTPVLYSPTLGDNVNGSAAGTLGTAFNPVSQTFTGSGTTADPYKVTTVVQTNTNVGGVVTLTETDTYVVGNDFYTTEVLLQNTEDATVSGILYHAGDCFLRGFDAGFGAQFSGTAACTINPNNSPPSALAAFVPTTGGNDFTEEPFGGSTGAIWGDVASQARLSNNCDCTTQEDNAMGIDWSFSNLTSTGTTFTWQNRVDDPTFTATGGQTFSGVAPLTVNGTVATISDPATSTSPSDYTATVNWGDGTTDQDATITGSNGRFSIADAHTYATTGTYTITVTVSYTTNPSISSVASDTANVTSVPTSVSSQPSVPTAVTTGAPTVSGTSAAFMGSANPTGSLTTVHFEYGLDPKYFGGGPVVYTASTPNQSIGSGFTTQPFSAPVSGLVPNAVYHVRFVATNSFGTSFGPDVTFTTPSTSPPGSPTVGKTFNISPVSGVVLIRINGQLVPLTELRQFPANALIDALNGTLSLTTAVGGHPASDAAVNGKKHKGKVKTQTGTFGGAIFRITQAHNGLATLSLVEGAFQGAPSYASCGKGKKGKAADASAAALSTKTLQLLHASAKGKFATRGKYAAATVRGTKWTIADKCNGTLTHDLTDSVAVTDFVHHKTVVLHAGQTYLAKKP